MRGNAFGAGLVLALAVGLLLPAAGIEARPRDDDPPARPLAGDRELLQRVALDSRIVTDRSRPGPTLWVQDAGLAFSRWMTGWMDRVLPGFNRWLGPWIEPALKALLALLAAVLLIYTARWARERAADARRRRASDRRTSMPSAVPPAAGEARDRQGELERRLESGDVTASTEALWWWLAGVLVGDRAEASWTSRELVARAGRRDLLADVRRLDRLMYGAGRRRIEDVRDLWRALRTAVG